MPTFYARLINGDQQPLPELTVRVIGWSLEGLSEPLAEGESDAEGTVTLEIEFAANLTLLPRLGLQLHSDSGWRDLADAPSKVSLKEIDFGALVVAEPPATPIDPTKSKAGPFEMPKNQAGLGQALLEAMAERDLLDAKVVALDQERQSLIGKTEALAGQIATLTKKDLALEAQLATAQAALDEAKASLSDHEQASPLVAVVENVGGQLGAAAKALGQAGLGMVLGDVSVSLKGVSSGAGKFEFPSTSRLQQLAGVEMSTIDMTFHSQAPQPSVTVKEPPQGPGMPNLLGYTELLARRKLEPLQLAIEVSQKAVARPDQGPSPWGRVVEQSPAPGGKIVPGSRVEILIGKPIDEQKKG